MRQKIFDFLPSWQKKIHNQTIRATWDDYGISKARYRKLRSFCQHQENASLVNHIARNIPFIADYIVLSVTEKKSFEDIEYAMGCRIPCGRTDFYGYRRLFYSLLDKELKT